MKVPHQGKKATFQKVDRNSILDIFNSNVYDF